MNKIDKLLASESFFNFAHHRNPDDVAKWEKWIEENPQHRELVERSRLVANSLRFHIRDENPEITSKYWKELQNRIRKKTYKSNKAAFPTRRLLYSMAAVLVGVLVSTVLWFQLWHNPMITFETDIAQRATLKLPDGSEMTLNRNSTVRFRRSWANDSVRRVWLDGEARFNINRDQTANGNYRRFEVHTPELLIDVVGTVFNVNTMDRSRVVLESGRVDIRRHGDAAIHTLKPGQSVVINRAGELVMSEPKLKPHISWVDGKILLNDNSLREIIRFIEGSYDLRVRCDDESLLDRKLSGQVRLDNIDDLLNVLEKILDLVIVRDDDTVKIIEIKKQRIHV